MCFQIITLVFQLHIITHVLLVYYYIYTIISIISIVYTKLLPHYYYEITMLPIYYPHYLIHTKLPHFLVNINFSSMFAH